MNNTTTMMAILLLTSVMMLVGGLALVPTATTQEAYGDHTTRPNASEEGIQNGGESHGGGLSDHGCETSFHPNQHEQGSGNSGGECRHQSLVE